MASTTAMSAINNVILSLEQLRAFSHGQVKPKYAINKAGVTIKALQSSLCIV